MPESYSTYFVVYGLCVKISAERASIAAGAAALLPPGARSCLPAAACRSYEFNRVDNDPEDPGWQLRIDGSFASTAATVEGLFVYFKRDVRAFVARTSRAYLFVHAGVVGWQGRAIVLPGYSHSGKTTLVAALIRAGATYYSDDYALLDEAGNVHPYPTSLSFRTKGPERLDLLPEDLGAFFGTGALRPALVLFTAHHSGAHWSPKPLSMGESILRLLPHVPSAESSFHSCIRRLEASVRIAYSFESPRGEAAETARLILKLASQALSGPVATSPNPTVHLYESESA